MLRRLTLVLLLLWMCPALAEEPVLPASLREADTIEEAEAFLLYPPEDGLSGVEAGYIRYISQHSVNDPTFRDEYWLGGEKDSPLDLTLQQNRYGHVYTFPVGGLKG